LDQRTVLLKNCDQEGLVFFAGSASKKIQDMLLYPSVSLHFLWRELDRQVRIGGRAEKLSAALTTHYFIHQPDHQKPRNQTEEDTLTTRNFLIQQFNMMRSKFYGGGDRVAGHWNGYRVVPDHFEFWQGGGPRLRDRFIYQPASDGRWNIISAPD
jgi:pyridoxamine 5'-phosphate oxidase